MILNIICVTDINVGSTSCIYDHEFMVWTIEYGSKFSHKHMCVPDWYIWINGAFDIIYGVCVYELSFQLHFHYCEYV